MNQAISTTSTSQTRYAKQRAERLEAARIEQLANFGLALGWAFSLFGGFCWFCVISKLDALWMAMLITGLVLLTVAVLIPELLDKPCQLWMKLAHWQGWLVMSALLTLIYFTLITPVGWLLRRRRGTHPFYSWDDNSPLSLQTGWDALPVAQSASVRPITSRRRSLLTLLLSTVGFFYERGHYFVLPILVLLLVLGVILFFVQGSVLAPFIYTIF